MPPRNRWTYSVYFTSFQNTSRLVSKSQDQWCGKTKSFDTPTTTFNNSWESSIYLPPLPPLISLLWMKAEMHFNIFNVPNTSSVWDTDTLQQHMLCLRSSEDIKRWVLYPPHAHPIATPCNKSHPKRSHLWDNKSQFIGPQKMKVTQRCRMKDVKSVFFLLFMVHVLARSSVFLHSSLQMKSAKSAEFKKHQINMRQFKNSAFLSVRSLFLLLSRYLFLQLIVHRLQISMHGWPLWSPKRLQSAQSCIHA